MLIILSPAKKMDFERPIPVLDHTQPVFMKKTWKLVSLLKKKDASFLASLMKLSNQLAQLNNQRYKDFTKTPRNARQALFVFDGDVYRGLNIERFKKKDITHAQKHLRILSGLYGLLSPLDLIQAYRLEMGVKFHVDEYKDLYGYWRDSLTKEIQQQLKKHKYLINLASKEYSSAIDFSSIEKPIITPIFKEKRKGTLKIIGLFAKKARGMLARHILLKRMKTLDDIKEFDEEGYRFNKDISSSSELVFCR